jgi:AcrR family transcriptional regulator
LVVIHEPRKTPRARRRDANLQRILDAATQMVAESGLAALSMGKLAEAVDYTPGALYRYFGSKDALLSQLVEKILEDVRALLDRAEGLLPRAAPPLARVFALVQGYRAFARLQPHRFGLLAMTMAEPRVLLREAEHAEPVVRVMIGAMQRLAAALGAATEAGLLSPGEIPERTICLFAMLQGVLQLQKQARYAPDILDIDRLVVRGTRALLLGWGARTRTVDAAVARVAALGDLTEQLGGAA